MMTKTSQSDLLFPTPDKRRTRPVATEKPASKPHYHGHRARLRERFLKSNGSGLADYEILEMLLFASQPRGDVKPLAKRLIDQFGSLRHVLTAPIDALRQCDGMGESAIASIKLVEHASQHLLESRLHDTPILSGWQALLDFCHATMAHQKTEQFRILFLNRSNRLLANEVQQQGTVNHATVYIREVLKRALELQASALILVHNHPSGDPTPSQSDIDLTDEIVEAGKPLGIIVHEHLIIADGKHFSFKQQQLLV